MKLSKLFLLSIIMLICLVPQRSRAEEIEFYEHYKWAQYAEEEFRWEAEITSDSTAVKNGGYPPTQPPYNISRKYFFFKT